MFGQVLVAANIRATLVQTFLLFLAIGFSEPNFGLLLRLCSFDCMDHIKPWDFAWAACWTTPQNEKVELWEQSKGQVEERISLQVDAVVWGGVAASCCVQFFPNNYHLFLFQFRLFSHVPCVVPNWAVWWAVQVWEGLHWCALLEVSKAEIMSKIPAL